jgi:hypothetical protein
MAIHVSQLAVTPALSLTCLVPRARAQGNIGFSKRRAMAAHAITPDRFVPLVYTDLSQKEKQTR